MQLTPKQKAIQDAYGDAWEKVKDYGSKRRMVFSVPLSDLLDQFDRDCQENDDDCFDKCQIL